MSETPARANGAEKHPVSHLQEVLSRRGCAAGYHIRPVKNKLQRLLYRCLVSFEQNGQHYLAEAAARTKKDAKKDAASMLLEKLRGTDFIEALELDADPNDELATAKTTKETLRNVDVVYNPIGILQEISVSEHWLMPAYEDGPDEGQYRAHLFTVVCRLLDYRVAVKSPNKKTAKRLAALDMCIRLLEDAKLTEISKIKLQRVCSYYKEKDKDAQQAQGADGPKKGKTKEPQAGAEVEFEKEDGLLKLKFPMRQRVGCKLQKLRDTCLREPTIDAITMLEELAEEQHIKLTYIPLGKGINGDVTYVLRTAINAAGWHHGSGATDEEARKHAAANALQFIKNVSTKLVAPIWD